MPDDPVIMSEEPSSVRININDPSKPKAPGRMTKVEQKVPFKDRLISAFFGNEVNSSNFGDKLLKDYIVPTGLRMVNNAAQGTLKKTGEAVQMLLFGKVTNSVTAPTDYTSYSKPNAVQNKPTILHVTEQVETFAFTNFRDAEACLNYLRGRIREYNSVSVIDYFEWINTHILANYPDSQIPLDYNLTYRGWMDLSGVGIKSDPNGYIIDFPRPVSINSRGK